MSWKFINKVKANETNEQFNRTNPNPRIVLTISIYTNKTYFGVTTRKPDWYTDRRERYPHRHNKVNQLKTESFLEQNHSIQNC